MLKQFLTIWLIVCTLGYGAVWAFDGHINQAETHPLVDENPTGMVDALNDHDHHNCDHCCHASAHIVALRAYESDSVFSRVHHSHFSYRQSLLVHSVLPLLRPPKV